MFNIDLEMEITDEEALDFAERGSALLARNVASSTDPILFHKEIGQYINIVTQLAYRVDSPQFKVELEKHSKIWFQTYGHLISRDY